MGINNYTALGYEHMVSGGRNQALIPTTAHKTMLSFFPIPKLPLRYPDASVEPVEEKSTPLDFDLRFGLDAAMGQDARRCTIACPGAQGDKPIGISHE